MLYINQSSLNKSTAQISVTAESVVDSAEQFEFRPIRSSKGNYLRFLCRVIGDENHFPTNKNLVSGAYIDQLFMPDNFGFIGRKNFISKKWPKDSMGSTS